MGRIEWPLDIGDSVAIDGDSTLSARVVALLWRQERPEVHVSWIHEGDIKFEWLPPWRLTKSQPKDTP